MHLNNNNINILLCKIKIILIIRILIYPLKKRIMSNINFLLIENIIKMILDYILKIFQRVLFIFYNGKNLWKYNYLLTKKINKDKNNNSYWIK